MAEWNETAEKSESLNDENRVTDDVLSEQSKSPKKSFVRDALDYLEIFVVALCAVILLFSFGFRLCTVSGPSMEKTLFDGEQLIISDLFYEPEAGDIVVFHQLGTLNEPVVKRVIAVEGEKVLLQYSEDFMTVTVTATDGTKRVLEEPYMYFDTNSLIVNRNMEYTVGEGQLFVMGDNRNHSTDSRSREIGMVDKRSVLGKVIFRIAPFDRFGTVD